MDKGEPVIKRQTAKTREPFWLAGFLVSLSKGMRVKCGIRHVLMYNFMRGGLIVDVFFNYLILSIEKKCVHSMWNL